MSQVFAKVASWIQTVSERKPSRLTIIVVAGLVCIALALVPMPDWYFDYGQPQDMEGAAKAYDSERKAGRRGPAFEQMAIYVGVEVKTRRRMEREIIYYFGEPDFRSVWGTQPQFTYFYDKYGQRDGKIVLTFGKDGFLNAVGFDLSAPSAQKVAD